MYLWTFTLGMLFQVVVAPMAILLMSGKWAPSETVYVVVEALWVVHWVPQALWKFSYVLTYVNIPALKAIFTKAFVGVSKLLLTRLVYTISCAMYSPTLWNIPHLIYSFADIVFTTTNDASMVTFRLRQTREDYHKYFSPKKGCGARVQFVFTLIILLIDIGRHLAVLYSVAAMNEAHGLDEANFADLSLAGKAFQPTIIEVVNASYTASIIFQAMAFLGISRAGGFGQVVHTMPNYDMVDTK
jgi:hypothetical protein